MKRPALLALAAALALGGCATAAIDDNYAAVERFGRKQAGGAPRWLRDDAGRAAMAGEVDRLLAAPLSRDDAVRIALGYSPAFQAVLADAAAASADATRTARVPNPVFEFERLVRTGEGEGRALEVGRALRVSLLEILLLPARRERAALQQQQLRLEASAALLDTVAETRRAWIDAVAAEQIAAYRDEVAGTSAAAAELARRMQAAGNYGRLQRAREQALHADTVTAQIRARQQALAAREALVRTLGLAPGQAERLRLPERLPDLPAAPLDEATVARTALDERLDVRLARAALDGTAKELGLTRVTSVVNGLELAAVRNSETGERPQRGYALELPLPLFDFGDANRAGAEARYLAALNRTARAARDASSEVRAAYDGYRHAFDLARHYRDEVVPLRQSIAEEAVLQYNGMLIGVFELFAETRTQLAAVVQSIEVQRDFWLAEAALDTVRLGRPDALRSPRPRAAATAAAGPTGGH